MVSRPDTESLTHGVTGWDSLSVPPNVKPVIKTTPEEALALKREGYFGNDKEIFKLSPKVAYIIDKEATHNHVGAETEKQSLSVAKKWLTIGGNAESELLGYPKRDGIPREAMIDVAVMKDGAIITDLDAMRNGIKGMNIAWAAEGLPDEIMAKAQEISSALKGDAT